MGLLLLDAAGASGLAVLYMVASSRIVHVWIGDDEGLTTAAEIKDITTTRLFVGPILEVVFATIFPTYKQSI